MHHCLYVLLEAALHPFPNTAPLPCLSAQLPPARRLLQCIMPIISAFAARSLPHNSSYDADDRDEVPSTSSRQAVMRNCPTKLDATTGAAQAVRELKAEQRRRGMRSQDKRPGPDKVHMDAAAGQDTNLPAVKAVP